MPELGVDFQPRRPGLLAVVLVLAGGVLLADSLFEESAQRERLAETESRLAQAQRRADRIETTRKQSHPEQAFTTQEAVALRQAFGAIGVDWELLFTTIDAAMGEEVALLALRPSVSGKSVQITGEARNMEAALGFVEALRKEPLSQVNLVSHQVRENDPYKPTAFEISATWKPGS